MIQTVLFDLDGTLTDPKVGITKSIAYALQKFHIQVTDLDELIPFIGPPLLDSFMEFYHMKEEDALTAIVAYREYFSVTGLYENAVYPGVLELLQHLNEKNINCILATSKPEQFAIKILEHFQLTTYFQDICGASMDTTRNKKADVIAYAIEKNHLQKQHVIMVGDRKHDIEGAIANDLLSIGVTYGYGSYEELHQAKATTIISGIKELEKHLIALSA